MPCKGTSHLFTPHSCSQLPFIPTGEEKGHSTWEPTIKLEKQKTDISQITLGKCQVQASSIHLAISLFVFCSKPLIQLTPWILVQTSVIRTGLVPGVNSLPVEKAVSRLRHSISPALFHGCSEKQKDKFTLHAVFFRAWRHSTWINYGWGYRLQCLK